MNKLKIMSMMQNQIAVILKKEKNKYLVINNLKIKDCM